MRINLPRLEESNNYDEGESVVVSFGRCKAYMAGCVESQDAASINEIDGESMTTQDKIECQAYLSNIRRTLLFTVVCIVTIVAATRAIHHEIQRSVANGVHDR